MLPSSNSYAGIGPASSVQDSLKADKFLERSKEASNSGNYPLGMELAEKAESMSLSEGNDEGVAKALTYRADILLDLQRPEEARKIVFDALERFSNTTQVSQFYNILGTSYSILEEPMKAAEQFNKAMQYLDRLAEVEADRLRAGLLQNLAVIYRDLGQYEKAFQNYLESIEYARSVKDTSSLAITYNNLGLAYSDNQEYEKAQYYLKSSLQLARERNSQIDMYRAYLNLANTFGNTEEYETALSYYDSARVIISKIRPGNPSPIIMHNRGATLAKLKRYEEAEELLFQSLQMSNEQGINEGIYYNNFVIGTMYVEQSRYEEAIVYLKRAESVSQSLFNIDLKMDVTEELHDAYAKNGSYEEAYRQLLNYSALSDSVNKAEKDRELANAESMLELDRQNEINSLLQEKQLSQEQQLRNRLIIIVTGIMIIILILFLLYHMRMTSREKERIYIQLKKQKEELEDLNRSKDKLFAIISHDLRSPLMSMQGMLSLIKEDFLSQAEIRELVPELEASIQENSNVMEDLLTWAKEQLSGVEVNLRPVSVSDLTADVIQSQIFIADKKKIKLLTEIEKTPNVLADYNALSLVIRNLISNAIKFSNPGDEIIVSAKEKPEHILIKVQDTGIGIPQDAHEKIFQNQSWTRLGTQNEKGTGFGLSLSKEFVERMNGLIWFESKESQGTEFFIQMPKA